MFPSINNLRRDLRRQRQRVQNPLPVPQSRDAIDKPLVYRNTIREPIQRFLVHDSGDADRLLMFATDEGE